MANFFKDNEDLRFYMDKWIDWETLVRVTENDYRTPDGFKKVDEAVAFYREIMEMIGSFAAEEIAPHAAQLDHEKVSFKDGEVIFPERLQSIFDQIKELGLHGMCLPRELDGMGAPLIMYYLSSEMMGRGDVSVMAHHGFHGGMALAMLIFSVREGTTKIDPKTGQIVETRFPEFIKEIAEGTSWGSMDITEPDAGSDMAALRTKGEQDEEGNWFVTGQKIFITSGHARFHFVIARTEEASDPDDAFAGLGGLSMFLVPSYEIDEKGEKRWLATLDRIEDKLGHSASATVQISFERTPAYLLGKRGEGFKYMLLLMNNARLGVGFECLGLCEASYRLARDYAAERRSMGKTIDKHEMIAEYLDEMRTDIQCVRALAVHGAFHEEVAQKSRLFLDHAELSAEEKREVERIIKRSTRKARRATPLLKYLAAEKAVELARRGIQIHGGVGYTKEYGAEKLLRDALVMPIYEGTSQIQSLMAMKDTLGGIIKDPQRFVRRAAEARWRSLSSNDPLERRVAKLQALSLSVQRQLMVRTAGDKLAGLSGRPVNEWPDAFLKNWDPKRDFAFAMLHAERLTRILTDELVAELLLEQAKAHPERREVLARHLEYAEPRCRYLADRIENGGERLLEELSDGPEATQQAAE